MNTQGKRPDQLEKANQAFFWSLIGMAMIIIYLIIFG